MSARRLSALQRGQRAGRRRLRMLAERAHPLPKGAVPAHPWPVPAALAIAVGIVCAYHGLELLILPLLLLPLPWLLAPLLLTDRSSAAPAAGRIPALIALLLPVLLIPVGHIRMGQWIARPNPLAESLGSELQLSGFSDGRTLHIERPLVGRAAIAPSGSLPRGQVELVGTLLEPPGKRNPGGFDYRAYLRRRGVHAQVLVGELLSAQPVAGLRGRLQRGVTSGLAPAPAALQEAMTLGVRDELDELQESFAAAGLAHVLALSGLHVGLLMAAVGWLLAPLGLLRYPLLIALDLGFMVLVGATPSVVRAALMVAVVLLGLWLGAGRIRPWPALGLAATVTLLLRPAWLFDISLQLSYGAVAGILLFGLPLLGRLAGEPRLPWWHPRLLLGASLVTSISAQALTLPLVASSFGTVPLLSPVVNLLALPLASVLVPLGFVAGLLGLVWLPLAALCNAITAPLAQLLIAMAEVGSRLPQLTWGEVSPVGYLYYGAALTALALTANGAMRLRRAVLVTFSAGLLSAVTPSPYPEAELVVLDVGQGDSILVRLPGRVEVLVDGGGTPFSDYDVGAGTVLPALRALGIDEIELVIATHSDLDHIEGLPSVLRGIPVQMLVHGPHVETIPAFEELLLAARERNVKVRAVSRGERLRLGAATLTIINPPYRSYGTSNDDSVAVQLQVAGGASALLLGDISSTVERDLAVPEVDYLVAPHHGSRSSSSDYLLLAARPKEVVISAGRNSYGHPSGEVVERIRATGARLYVTKSTGAVRLPLLP